MMMMTLPNQFRNESQHPLPQYPRDLVKYFWLFGLSLRHGAQSIGLIDWMRCNEHGDYHTPPFTLSTSYPLGWVTHSTPIDSHWVVQSASYTATLVDIYGVSTMLYYGQSTTIYGHFSDLAPQHWRGL